MMLLNTANILTLCRIAAIPLVVACFWLDRGWSQWLSMILFVLAAVTDWFDGYFARRYHQISRFGRFLDPIADKLLVAAALLMLVDMGPLAGIHVLAALIILAREILVSGLREFLAELRVGLPVTLRQIGIEDASDKLLREVAIRATAAGETIHNEPFVVTADMVADAIRTADAMGKAYISRG